MLCPKCNKPLSDKSRFCKYCGSKNETSCIACGHNNPENAEFCAKCGTRLDDFIYCEKCGVANFPDEEFCRECSASIKQASGPVAKAVLPPGESIRPIKRSGIAKKLGFLLLLCVLSGGGFALLMHNSPQPLVIVTPNPIPGPGPVVTPPVNPTGQQTPLQITAELDKNFYLSNKNQEVAALLRIQAGDADIIKSFYSRTDKKIALSTRPEHFIIAADISGSMMRDNRMESLKKLIKNIIKNMKKNDRATLFTYNNSAETIFSDHTPDDKSDSQARLFEMIDQIEAAGGTNFEDALIASIKALNNKSHSNPAENNCIKRIILISDGRPTVGKTAIAELENTIRPAFADPDTRVVTIAMGTDVNVYLLARLARTFGGQYIYNDSLIKGETINIFSDDAEGPKSMETPRITDVDIHVTPLNGADVTKAILGTMRTLGDKACFYLENIAINQQKNILFKMITSNLKPGMNDLFLISGTYVIRFEGTRKTFKISPQTININTPALDSLGSSNSFSEILTNSHIINLKRKVQAAKKLIVLSKEMDNSKRISSNEIDDLQALSKEDAEYFQDTQQSVKEGKEKPSRASRKIHYRGTKFLNQQ